MPVKIRLQRHGKKGKPFYWIVAADGRAKRDGKYLEKLGTYNPNVNPAQIDLNVDGAVNWLQNGAQPTDTARAILSYKGVMLKNHLAGGVRKGALTEEEAEKKFNDWVAEKEKAVENKRIKLAQDKKKEKEASIAAEKAVNEARIAAAQEVETATEEAAAEGETATTEVETTEEAAPAEAVEAPEAPAVEETPATEEATAEESAETPAEEPAEAKTEEVAEASAEEEAPAAEEAKEEAAKEEE